MTETSTAERTTIEQADDAWIEAWVAGPEAMRELLHPDCRVVHAAIGRIDTRDEFLEYTATYGQIFKIDTFDRTVRHFGSVAVVTALQELRVAYVAGRTPFVIQAPSTRVWVHEGTAWKLANLQVSRRFPPG